MSHLCSHYSVIQVLLGRLRPLSVTAPCRCVATAQGSSSSVCISNKVCCSNNPVLLRKGRLCLLFPKQQWMYAVVCVDTKSCSHPEVTPRRFGCSMMCSGHTGLLQCSLVACSTTGANTWRQQQQQQRQPQHQYVPLHAARMTWQPF